MAAVKAVGLAEALPGEGPFTVFAPTNGAFAALPEGAVAELLKPENKEKLGAILKCHVVAADVKAGEVEMLSGNEATMTIADGGVMIDTAKIVKTDIVDATESFTRSVP